MFFFLSILLELQQQLFFLCFTYYFTELLFFSFNVIVLYVFNNSSQQNTVHMFIVTASFEWHCTSPMSCRRKIRYNHPFGDQSCKKMFCSSHFPITLLLTMKYHVLARASFRAFFFCIRIITMTSTPMMTLKKMRRLEEHDML